MSQVNVPYRPSFLVLIAGFVLCAIASFGLAQAALATQDGIALGRMLELSAEDVMALRWAGAIIGGVMAAICAISLVLSVVGGGRIVITASDITIPTGAFSEPVTVPLSNIISLRIRPNKGQDVLEVRHRDGAATIEGAMLRSPYTLASVQRLLREKVEELPKTAEGRRRRNPAAPYVFNPKQTEMGFAPRAFGRRQDV
jgi:hypothetical protein